MSRICVFGAGAIGGLIGGKLIRAQAGEVSLVARGAHLEAMRERGLTVAATFDETEHFTVPVRATDDPRELGPQDYVLLAVKAHAVPKILDALEPLLGPETAVVTLQNGIPWWYFHGIDSPFAGRTIESVDPGGVIWKRVGPERAIGCVVYPAAEVSEPGVITWIEGDRLPVGEPDGSRSERVRRLSQLLVEAGFKAPVRPDIRSEIWIKLWGNLAFNPLSVLTCATLDVLATDPGTRAVARTMMEEARVIGERLGVRFVLDVDRRIEGAAQVGPHKTSMLQDLERGRPLEIDAILGAVRELGEWVEAPCPTIDVVLALTRLRARVAGLHP